MLNTTMATRAMVVAPHHLAGEAGLSVLRAGGNAIEAMVAAAAAIAVVYPHMNAIGGDGFWLIHVPGRDPVAIRACGGAGASATAAAYRGAGHDTIPARGPLAANTVAGTIGGWAEAMVLAREIGGAMPLERLLEEAIHHGEAGVAVSASQAQLTKDKLGELADVPGFADTFLLDGAPPPQGHVLKQPRLAATLRDLAANGLDGFYRGPLARRIAADLARAGALIDGRDLETYRAQRVQPLSVRLSSGTVFNHPPPTQGLASLMILAIFDRLGVERGESFDHVHGLVEATKQAFLVRDRAICDPAVMDADPAGFLDTAFLDAAAARIERKRALAWPRPARAGDTVWMGAADANGCAVSFIQSIYWEFGSGVVLEDTGILWQNRGSGFSLDPAARNALAPGRLPFHTLNPALARLGDGRVMVYGAMGGDGQPQTQAQIFSRHVAFGQGLQHALSAPRWLLGRTWGDQSTTLKLESRFDKDLLDQLAAAGHNVEVIAAFDDLVGHAGAIVRQTNRLLAGAGDPRSDGGARGF